MANMNALTDFEKDQVIQFLTYHMDMETRHKLIRTLPVAYAKMYGQCITVQIEGSVLKQTINFGDVK